MEKSSSELSQMISDKENELKQFIAQDYEVELAILKLQSEIIDRQKQKKDLEIARSKSNYNIKKIRIEISTLTKTYWNTKNQGL